MDEIRMQIADVLRDFASVLLEEMAYNCDLHVKREMFIMDRLNGVIEAFLEGDTSVENAYKHRKEEA